MTYNWDLIEHLLHAIQNGSGATPSASAAHLSKHREQLAVNLGEPEALKQQAGAAEQNLLSGGFIKNGPAGKQLTQRGSQLLALIDSSIPGNDHPRQVLDERGSAALVPEVFDVLASKVAIAGGVNN